MRARITITDVVYILLALAALAAFYPVYAELFGRLAPDLASGPEAVLGTVLPAAAIVLLSVIYLEARSG